MPGEIEDFTLECKEGQCVRFLSLEGLKTILYKPEDWIKHLLRCLSIKILLWFCEENFHL